MAHSLGVSRCGKAVLIASLLILGGTAVLVFCTRGAAELPSLPATRSGGPQLVSIETLPEEDGLTCPWIPASANASLIASLQDSMNASGSSPDTKEARTSVDADREPVRVIRDTYPAYSNVAVDSDSGEVYLQDENLFGLKVFNRLDNTPAQASFTEPKRMLGGLKTRIEYNCGLYIDPHNGDVYSLADDTVSSMVVFPHDAQGNVAPKRELVTPRATFSMAIDDESQEIFMSVQPNNSVIVYRKMAEGKEPPLRQIIGDHTQLADPHGIAVDTKTNLLFVNNQGLSHSTDGNGKTVPATGRFTPPSITVYPLKARGDIAPLRVIQGPKTRLNWAAGMYLDQDRGELYVANDADNSILVFRETDEGNVAPLRVVKGAKTGLQNPSGVFVDAKHHELWVSNMGNHSATAYSLTADGDVAPLRTIRSAPAGKLAAEIGNPGGAGYDTKRDEILVPN